ncbi:MAG TPA: outer membrane protein assembly factor BamC [Gammaproteobacteria bacterium]|nr:outer membrane protein assembly factor BamC [Gammaproteobacteria bacterium]
MRLCCVIILISILAGCSYIPKLDEVLPDKRTEYKKSESLPGLEVPPDLTTARGEGAMGIPGEATLSEYKRQEAGLDTPQGAVAGGGVIAQASSTAATAGANWVLARGETTEVWARLGRYFIDQGYLLDLNDLELGVLETDWSPPLREGGFIYHDKFKIFSEPGETPGTLVLFIGNSRQEQVFGSNGAEHWVDQGNNPAAEQRLVADLDVFFNGAAQFARAAAINPAPATPAYSGAASGAVIQRINDGREFLNLPEEFSFAWRKMETILASAGLVISSMNESEGIYSVTYYPGGKQVKKKGWASKLKFWDRDEPRNTSGSEFKISLTGVGNRTELIVLDANGNWETSPESTDVLELIRSYYSRS